MAELGWRNCYRRFFETAKMNLKRLADAGVPYGFGTDTKPSGRFPAFFDQWEMELMVEAGLTPMQVIVAATGRGKVPGHQSTRHLEPGRWTDLVVLESNPLANIKNTRSTRNVYIAGNRVH